VSPNCNPLLLLLLLLLPMMLDDDDDAGGGGSPLWDTTVTCAARIAGFWRAPCSCRLPLQ